MAIDGLVVNTPSDLTPVACPFNVYLPIAGRGTSTSSEPIVPEEPLEPEQCYIHTERAVANGMMMVLSTPMSASTAFSPGQNITAPLQASVYLGPGSNYAVLTTIPAGTSGTVLPHAAGLEGVFAKGQHWWKVDFGGIEGWVTESVLSAIP